VQRASTDANIPLSLGREAIAIGGGGSGGGAHTLQEWFDCNGRDLGLRRILLTMLTLSGVGVNDETRIAPILLLAVASGVSAQSDRRLRRSQPLRSRRRT
jgi:hypothetical protein